MKHTIYKHELELTDEQKIQTFEQCTFLDVQIQHGKICVWVLVNLDSKQVYKTIRIIGTGNPIKDSEVYNLEFIGTVQQDVFVWHIFCKSEN